MFPGSERYGSARELGANEDVFAESHCELLDPAARFRELSRVVEVEYQAIARGWWPNEFTRYSNRIIQVSAVVAPIMGWPYFSLWVWAILDT